ncbi:MAG: GNAT family N-acetyltransferase [Alphaproteobacteria bacterium]|nr:GNAT family N-acetyltransferase [Alphaproteobacteria bacterium]
MSALYPIVTDRLILRRLLLDDFEALHAFLSLPEVAQYQFWEPMDRDKVAEKLADWMTLDGEEGRHLELGVVLKSSGRLIGDVFLGFRDLEARQGEIGFSLHPDVQRQGYGFEAVGALIDLGFEHYALHRIFGRCDARNPASYKLMEKLGMRREAHFREHALFKGGWDEEYYYAILEHEWRAKNGPAS